VDADLETADNWPDGEPEIPLGGDGVTPDIVRVGDTVRRPLRPFSLTVQAFLAHLRAQGFDGAPIPIGVDAEGREVLSFVAGDVPREPLPDAACSDDVLVALARLIRRLHDAARGWEPPSDAVWGAIPGRPHPDARTLFAAPELVSHRDYCPGNVVFRDGIPAALIDFDLARPTTRLYDIANALYWWAQLLDPLDRAPVLRDVDVAERVALFADAYDMDADQRTGLMPLAIDMVHNFHLSAREAAKVDPVFARFWDDGVRDKMPRAEAWLAANATAITAALLD
jgi:hypothetical protein